MSLRYVTVPLGPAAAVNLGFGAAGSSGVVPVTVGSEHAREGHVDFDTSSKLVIALHSRDFVELRRPPSQAHGGLTVV